MEAEETITTVRLHLPVWRAAAIAAMIAGDGGRLGELTGAVWPEPLVAPPLMEDALPFFVERLREDPGLGPWWARVLVIRGTRQAVGSAGLTGRPDGEGSVTVGYAVYPAFQGQGFAAEAVRGIVGWALARPGVARVRATIPAWHTASRRVAEKAGLERVGTVHDDDEGELEEWATETGQGSARGDGGGGVAVGGMPAAAERRR